MLVHIQLMCTSVSLLQTQNLILSLFPPSDVTDLRSWRHLHSLELLLVSDSIELSATCLNESHWPIKLLRDKHERTVNCETKPSSAPTLATNDDPCHTDTSSNHTRCITARALRTPTGHQLNMYFLQIHDCLILKDYLCRQIITIWSSLLQIKPFFVVTRAPRTRTYYTYYPHHSLQQTGSWAGTSLPVSHWSGSWNCQECFLPVASGLGNLTRNALAIQAERSWINLEENLINVWFN